MDRCEAVGHSARRRHRQCNRSQQAGRFDGRRNRAVEELDIESIDVDSHGGVNFEHLQVRSPRQVHAKYGSRGIRVSEAAHPGPPSSRVGVVHPWELSSDDEPLVPGAVRNVAPRLMGFESVGVTQIDQESSGTVPPTVPATPGADVNGCGSCSFIASIVATQASWPSVSKNSLKGNGLSCSA